jgi:hypothetical protein
MEAGRDVGRGPRTFGRTDHREGWEVGPMMTWKWRRHSGGYWYVLVCRGWQGVGGKWYEERVVYMGECS